MRIRSIKPEFWRSDDITALSLPARLLFVGLWSYVDDNGVGVDDVKVITADLFAKEDDISAWRDTVSRGLRELASSPLVTRYTVSGKPFLHVTSWEQHQKIDRPSKPRYPLPDEADPPGNVDLQPVLDEPSTSPRDTLAAGAVEQGNRGAVEQGNAAVATRPPITVNQRAQQLAKTYTDRVPMSRFPAILGIAKKAIEAGHPDEHIEAALLRLAAEGRSVTVESLRVELEGHAPTRSTRRTADDRVRDGLALAQQLAEQDAQPRRQIGA